MSISTRTGDSGQTDLLFGRRVSKTHPRVVACGAVDELNAALGLARAQLAGTAEADTVEAVQRMLVNLMGELAVETADVDRYAQSKLPKFEPDALAMLDEQVAAMEASVRFAGWIMPGANPTSAALDYARTVCRRAEREIVSVMEAEAGRHEAAARYLNRLADVLWLMARRFEAAS